MFGFYLERICFGRNDRSHKVRMTIKCTNKSSSCNVVNLDVV